MGDLILYNSPHELGDGAPPHRSPAFRPGFLFALGWSGDASWPESSTPPHPAHPTPPTPPTSPTMDQVFIYWDNSNIYIGAKNFAELREGKLSRGLVRIHFKALLRLAGANRRVEKAVVAGSTPPGARELWDKLRGEGVQVEELFDRGDRFGKEQEVPDERLQNRMLMDAMKFAPGVVVLLTGDGKGRRREKGFHYALELLRARGWRVELLAWRGSCHRGMREWVEKNGVFVPLDEHYESVTFLKQGDFPGRRAEQVDFSRRPTTTGRGEQ